MALHRKSRPAQAPDVLLSDLRTTAFNTKMPGKVKSALKDAVERKPITMSDYALNAIIVQLRQDKYL